MKTYYPPPVIGAFGWRHPQWYDDFYPQDLPQEWELAFYANEFLTVLVPQSQWLDCAPADCQAWLDDGGANFRWFLHCDVPDDATVHRIAAVLRQEHWPPGSISGVLMNITNEEFVSPELAKEACFGCPVFVGYSGVTLAAHALPDGMNPVWNLHNPLPVPPGMSLSVGWIQEAEVQDDRRLRAVIEDFMHRGGPDVRESFLFFLGAPPNVDVMRKALVIGQLL